MRTATSHRRRDFCKSSPRAACPSRKQLRAEILRKAFEVYDSDNSGSIDYDELRHLLRDLGWPCHDEFLHRAITVLDNDQSGTIDFSEFLSWTEFAYASRVLYPEGAYDISTDSKSIPHRGSLLKQGSFRGQLSRNDPKFSKARLSALLEEGPANNPRNTKKENSRFGPKNILSFGKMQVEDDSTEEGVRFLNFLENGTSKRKYYVRNTRS